MGALSILTVDTREDLRELISHDHSLVTLRRTVRGKGMRTLAEDGLQKAAAGLTTVEEVMRASAL